MKSLFVLLLLIVVVSVVRGTTKCYFCGRNCDEDHVVEATCQRDAQCLSIISTDPDSDIVSMKMCVGLRDSEDEHCGYPKKNGAKCYVCNDDFCNKNDEKESDDDEYDDDDDE
ncbi:hypothetical protein MTP99_008335 [Tenebrio molitor]|uniref:Activin types I and II receptor domain-containing protein n=1 Tax=Tenebrio molitor TaxID=7067 RepID=A0A8J6HG74_TENMO|nr:hypothetical protein GEV33_004576 [Tenebrio molitor]KAJ3635424.1 hypothetical protein MTP99_008335 [Tenebrio molitor]